MSDEPRLPSPKEARAYESEAYAIAVDDTFFVAREDWTDHPAFAMKFGRARVAAGRAQDEQEKFPTHRVRVIKLRQTFVVEEIG